MTDKLRPLEGRIDKSYEFEANETGNPVCYWIKGHVDKAEFVNEVNTYFGEDYNEQDVAHIYYRHIPAGRELPGMSLLYPSDPGCGAFPVTEIDITAAKTRRIKPCS